MFKTSPLYQHRRPPSPWILEEETSSPGFALNATPLEKSLPVSFFPPDLSYVSMASEVEPDTPMESAPFPILINKATQTEATDLLHDISSNVHLSLDIGSSPANTMHLSQSEPVCVEH